MTVIDGLNYIQGSALSHAISKSNHLLIAGFQVFHVHRIRDCCWRR